MNLSVVQEIKMNDIDLRLVEPEEVVDAAVFAGYVQNKLLSRAFEGW